MPCRGRASAQSGRAGAGAVRSARDGRLESSPAPKAVGRSSAWNTPFGLFRALPDAGASQTRKVSTHRGVCPVWEAGARKYASYVRPRTSAAGAAYYPEAMPRSDRFRWGWGPDALSVSRVPSAEVGVGLNGMAIMGHAGGGAGPRASP
jgi:hypothetical protein